MNRADHLLLNRLLGTTAVVALGALIAAWTGAGQQVDWQTGASGGTTSAAFGLPRTAAVEPPQPLDAETYTQVWRHNLFSTSRVPDAQRGDAGDDPLSGYTLTGVILSGSLHIALLTDPAGKGYSIVPGHPLPHTEWTLRDVDRREAHFEADGRDVTLPMRKTPPPSGRPAVPDSDNPADPASLANPATSSNPGPDSGARPNGSNGADAPPSAGASSGQTSLPPLPPGV